MIGMITSLAAFAFFSLVVLVLLTGIFFSRGSRDQGVDEDEARMLQEIYQGLEKLETRMEALEMIISDNEPVANKKEDQA